MLEINDGVYRLSTGIFFLHFILSHYC